MTAIGTMERISGETRLQVDYSCDLGQFELVYPILYIFSGLIAFLGVIILLRLDIDGLILVAVACVPYGIVRLVVLYYNTVLDGLHGRIMRILKKG